MKRLTYNETHLVAQVLEKVLSCLTEQDDVAEGTKWVDNGDFIIAMSGEQKTELYNALIKLKNG